MGRRLAVDEFTSALWRLDGTAIDVGPNALNGTLHGTKSVGVLRQPWSRAYQFVRSSSHWIEIDHDAQLETAYPAHELRFKLDSLPAAGEYYYLGSKYNATGNAGWTLALRNDGGVYKLRFQALTDAGLAVAEGVVVVNTDDWFSVVAQVVSGDELQLFLDQDEVATTALGSTGVQWSGTTRMAIGCLYAENGAGASDHFNGLIVEVRPSATERRAWHRLNTIAAVSDPMALLQDTHGDAIAIYNFNEAGEGAAVIDSTGQHHGTQTAAIAVVDGPISSKSRDLAGNGRRLVIPYSDAFTMTDNLTVATCLQVHNISSNGRRYWMFKTPSSGGHHQFNFLQVSNDRDSISFGVADDSSYIDCRISDFIVVNRWYFLVWVWVPSEKRVYAYRDGHFVASAENAAIVVANMDNTEQIDIGNGRFASNPCDGRMAALGFFRSAWDAERVYNTFHGTDVRESPWA